MVAVFVFIPFTSTKIDEEDVLIFINQQIIWFDVTMDIPFIMKLFN